MRDVYSVDGRVRARSGIHHVLGVAPNNMSQPSMASISKNKQERQVRRLARRSKRSREKEAAASILSAGL
jgi:hypothetical protein